MICDIFEKLNGFSHLIQSEYISYHENVIKNRVLNILKHVYSCWIPPIKQIHKYVTKTIFSKICLNVVWN